MISFADAFYFCCAMRYYIIAGEASGDLHGSNLIRELKLLDPAASIRGWGGDLMQEAGSITLVSIYASPNGPISKA